MPQELFVDKYHPNILADMILTPELRSLFQSFIDTKSIPHCTFAGRPGIGKSTLAKILGKEIGADVLYVNAAVDNNVDMIRTTVKSFCDAMSISGLKIIILDEADALTKTSGNGSSAQTALKNIIEENQNDSRFILTCNHLNKIEDAIKSRCRPISLSFSEKDVLDRIIMILKKENIKFSKESLTQFIVTVVRKSFIDIRGIISELSLWSYSGELKPYNDIAQNADALIEFILTEKDYKKIREKLIQSETEFGKDYVNLAQKLFDKVSDPKSQLIIAESLWRMTAVVDTEIEFTAMMIQLKENI